MARILAALFIIFWAIAPAHAASRILKGEFVSLEGRVLLLAEIGAEKKIIPVDLRKCAGEKAIPVDKSARSLLISRYMPSFAVIGGKELYIYDTAAENLYASFNDFLRSVFIVNQSDMGEYIAASDGLTAVLYEFKKNKLEKLQSLEFIEGVSAVYPDRETRALFVAEKSGVISMWSFSGKLIRNIPLTFTVSDIFRDGKTGKLLLTSSAGLFYMNTDNFQTEKFLNGRIKEAVTEEYSNRLEVMSDSGFTVYDYYSMRPIVSIGGANGNIIRSDGASFAAFASLNAMKIYDLKLNSHIASIAVDNTGAVNFLPPESEYGANIAASFIAAAAGNKGKETQVISKERVCAPIATMVSGVYVPKELDISYAANPVINDIGEIPAPAAPEINQIRQPEAVFGGSLPKEPEIKGTAAIKNPSNPNFISNTKNPDNAANPNTPDFKSPENMISAKVPNWLANRKNLPKYNAVASGATEAEALKTASLQLKNEAVREALNYMVKEKDINAIENTDVKKRLLWMASSSAVNSMTNKIKVMDKWVSPANQNYLHVYFDNGSIKETGNIYLQKELEKLRSMTESEYIKIAPNKLD